MVIGICTIYQISDMDNKLYDLEHKIDKYLKKQCKEETKNAFYQSKKGQELQRLDDLKKKQTDLLHS